MVLESCRLLAGILLSHDVGLRICTSKSASNDVGYDAEKMYCDERPKIGFEEKGRERRAEVGKG